MRKLILCILVSFLMQPAFATSIVILITPDYILLGTDSRRMVINNDTNKNTYFSACKIRSYGQYYYVMAGLVASANTNFFADSLVLKCLSETNDYKKATSLIKKMIANALQKDLKDKKKNHSSLYNEIIASPEPILEIAILRLKDNKPFVEIIGFQIENKKTLRIKTYSSTASPTKEATDNQMYMLGQYSGMETFLKETQTSDPVSLIDQMISVQSQITPTSVAKPISIIKYSAKGVEWLQ